MLDEILYLFALYAISTARNDSIRRYRFYSGSPALRSPAM